MTPGRSPRQSLVIGLVCGLLAVLVVRSAVLALVGAVKVLVVVGAVALLWVFLRGPRDGSS